MKHVLFFAFCFDIPHRSIFTTNMFFRNWVGIYMFCLWFPLYVISLLHIDCGFYLKIFLICIRKMIFSFFPFVCVCVWGGGGIFYLVLFRWNYKC